MLAIDTSVDEPETLHILVPYGSVMRSVFMSYQEKYVSDIIFGNDRNPM
jgi:hypothetical protein